MEVGEYFGIKVLLSILGVELALTLVLVVLQRRRQKQVSPYPLLGWLISGGLCMIGAALTLLQTHDLYHASQVRKWPSVEGRVLEAQIEGKRGFVPKVAYEYCVDGVTYTDKKELFSPQFGGKDTRRQSSQKIIAEYEKGGTITVYYNPKAPAESAVEIGVTWATFIKLGVGVLLFAASGCLILYKTAQLLLLKRSVAQTETAKPLP
ncbi:MAG: DUF3592 domain-containing protein [Candidatus Thermochlorobacter sp.]